MDDWTEVHEWRQAQRRRLQGERQALPRGVRKNCAVAVSRLLQEHAPLLPDTRLGFYWPIRGELDLVGFVRGILPAIREAALPVVVERRRPVEFWRWTSRTELCNRGIWNIPSPAEAR